MICDICHSVISFNYLAEFYSCNQIVDSKISICSAIKCTKDNEVLWWELLRGEYLIWSIAGDQTTDPILVIKLIETGEVVIKANVYIPLPHSNNGTDDVINSVGFVQRLLSLKAFY